jgi:hypothetical protein
VPAGKFKWQVKTAAYIGFGKGKMDVDYGKFKLLSPPFWTIMEPHGAPMSSLFHSGVGTARHQEKKR